MRRAFLLSALLLCACMPAAPSKTESLSFFSHSSSAASVAPAVSSEPEELQPGDVEEAPASEPAALSGVTLERVVDRGIVEFGVPDVPLLLVFTNPSCDYCTDFAHNQLPRLEQDFLHKGLLRIHTIILPLQKYPSSALDASALLCAAQQKKGRTMYDVLFDTPTRTKPILVAAAKKMSIDSKAFEKCLADPTSTAHLQEQQEVIANLHVTLIPSFFLYTAQSKTNPALTLGPSVTGLPTYADLRGMIENGLKR